MNNFTGFKTKNQVREKRDSNRWIALKRLDGQTAVFQIGLAFDALTFLLQLRIPVATFWTHLPRRVLVCLTGPVNTSFLGLRQYELNRFPAFEDHSGLGETSNHFGQILVIFAGMEQPTTAPFVAGLARHRKSTVNHVPGDVIASRLQQPENIFHILDFCFIQRSSSCLLFDPLPYLYFSSLTRDLSTSSCVCSLTDLAGLPMGNKHKTR